MQCQLNCVNPCATCGAESPNVCLSCLQGYTLNNDGVCQPNTQCNPNSNCIVCPFGNSLMTSNTNNKISQTCVQCTPSSNCARCSVSNPSQCYSCLGGTFLSGNVCVSCSQGCATCLNSTMCMSCAAGFVAQQNAFLISGVDSGALVNCTSCTGNCASCSGSPDSCTSCNSGFTLQGTICQSNFNYQVVSTLGVSLSVFQANYLSFLTSIAAAAGVSIRNILVKSITSGSVTVTMQVNSNAPAGSSAAITSQNNLNNLLSTGNTVANMGVVSSSVTTNGGNNDDDGNDNNNDNNHGNGGSNTKTIVLAVVIPVVVVGTFIDI